jgi:hypothetical protein
LCAPHFQKQQANFCYPDALSYRTLAKIFGTQLLQGTISEPVGINNAYLRLYVKHYKLFKNTKLKLVEYSRTIIMMPNGAKA